MYANFLVEWQIVTICKFVQHTFIISPFLCTGKLVHFFLVLHLTFHYVKIKNILSHFCTGWSCLPCLCDCGRIHFPPAPGIRFSFSSVLWQKHSSRKRTRCLPLVAQTMAADFIEWQEKIFSLDSYVVVPGNSNRYSCHIITPDHRHIKKILSIRGTESLGHTLPLCLTALISCVPSSTWPLAALCSPWILFFIQ